jgi:hypothetical protein
MFSYFLSSLQGEVSVLVRSMPLRGFDRDIVDKVQVKGVIAVKIVDYGLMVYYVCTEWPIKCMIIFADRRSGC